MSDIIPIVVLILVFVAGCAATALYKNMEKRIEDLEKASDKRHLPYKVAEEIEDATAAILKARREIDFDKEVLDNALGHLHNARNNR